MSYRSTLPLAVWLTIASCGLAPRDAQAGPLLDWLFGRRAAPAYPVGAPIPVGNGTAAGYGGYGAPSGYAGNYGTYYSSQLPAIGPAGAGYTAPMPSGIAAATLPATLPPTMSYVPNFQTNAQRAPVTYYRPLLTTDPNTGAQVVAMAPCTSYEYMAQRVPVLGRTALFGSNAPPVFQTPPQALPTYTLPSGGVPLAYAAPSITAPYSTAYGAYGTNPGYGGYSSLQPPMGLAPTSVGPAGNYPTTNYSTPPLGQSSFYGANNGGSCGGYSGPSAWQGVPGLVAPQSPATPVPSYQSPAYSQPSSPPPTTYAPVPGVGVPPAGAPSGVFPPTGPSSGPTGSSDPADYPPQLNSYPLPGTSAQSNLRPQLRSITRQPRADESPTVSSPTSQERDDSSRQLPTMLPIPVPEDFQHQPRWSPPLLRDGDMTAMRPIEPEVAQLAGQSKPIHWASFERSRTPQPATTPTTTGRLRPIQSPVLVETPVSESAAVLRPNTPASRVTGGWKVSRP